MRERAGEDAAHVERLWALAADRLGLSHEDALQPLVLSHPRAGGGPVATPSAAADRPFLRTARDWAPACAGVEILAEVRDKAPSRKGATGWTLNGPASHRYHGNLNLRRPGLDVARLMSDCRDIAFSAGSACASGSGRPSHVLRALGLSDAQARSSIRLGFGRYTTPDELMVAMDELIAAADRQQEPA